MTEGDLSGRVALVTGAAHRLGAATARRLHAAGADVAIHYHRSRQAAEALAEELEAAAGGRARAIGCALDDTANLGPLVESVAAALGGLDILVNNAARFYPTPLAEVTEAHWDDLMATNLKAPFFLAQAAAEHLAARGGCIVNLTDVYAERPLARHPVYSISKAGVAMLTRTLAKEMGPAVRVNGVAPGAALWPDAGLSEPDKEALLRHTALGRSSGPEPIADAVHFLATADYITGQILGIEGGRLLY
ncbi:MAG TPA: pteridine reductase [Gammaproteobacteria bacterium]|nr:pteridine reductase [Gammaproteobacteria bacterium]